MGLDIYAGPLCRYYTGAWKTIVEQMAPELGIPVVVSRPENDPDAITDPAEAVPLIEEWRAGIQAALEPEGIRLEWRELPEGQYFTDKPAWDCYGSLLLWAAYLEHPELEPPPVCPPDWSTDPAMVASVENRTKGSYLQLLGDTEFWLPTDFPFVFAAPDPVGNRVVFGSVQRLHEQLGLINSRSWNLSDAELVRWRKEGSEAGAPLEHAARFCLALWLPLLAEAIQHSVPIKLDY